MKRVLLAGTAAAPIGWAASLAAAADSRPPTALLLEMLDAACPTK